MERISRINDLMQGEIASLVNQNVAMPDGLITITYTKTSADLRHARIGISVLPEKLSGTALKLLRSYTSTLTGQLKKRLKIKFIPKIKWEIDNQERYAAKMDQVFLEIEKGADTHDDGKNQRSE